MGLLALTMASINRLLGWKAKFGAFQSSKIQCRKLPLSPLLGCGERDGSQT
jgi:hypothetical protein